MSDIRTIRKIVTGKNTVDHYRIVADLELGKKVERTGKEKAVVSVDRFLYHGGNIGNDDRQFR